jgi:hypothetical protein
VSDDGRELSLLTAANEIMKAATTEPRGGSRKEKRDED